MSTTGKLYCGQLFAQILKKFVLSDYFNAKNFISNKCFLWKNDYAACD